MTPSRRQARRPEIDGFEVIRLIGQGGFSDVFLCQQLSPRREVAVKVLLPQRWLYDEGLARFWVETDAMAQVSTHPNIVTIYGSGIAGDGSPFLTMEYCPNPSLAQGLRTHLRSPADVLAIGVAIAGAVETAHRSGILHRDIKPANILLTQYTTPALTDFGIASSLAEGWSSGVGMSVPWSPPEFFKDPAIAGVQSDVWSLGATLYTLLARRAPFQQPGGDNSPEAQKTRILRDPVPPIGRPDVPPNLERVLASTMAKDPQARYPSAFALGTALREIQNEWGLVPTPLIVTSDYAFDEEDEAEATRLRTVSDPSEGEARREVIAVADMEPTVLPQVVPPPPDDSRKRQRRRVGAIVAGAAAAVAMVTIAAVALSQPPPVVGTVAAPSSSVKAAPTVEVTPASEPEVTEAVLPRTRKPPSADGANPVPAPLASRVGSAATLLPGQPIAPKGTEVKRSGATGVVSWEAIEGMRYKWRKAGKGKYKPVDRGKRRVKVELSETKKTCIEVAAVDSAGKASSPVKVCVGKQVPRPATLDSGGTRAICALPGGLLQLSWTLPELGEDQWVEYRAAGDPNGSGVGEWTATWDNVAIIPRGPGGQTHFRLRTVLDNGDKSATTKVFTEDENRWPMPPCN
ncbi:MAG: protein kinase [Micrococcales bacterium]|nr:protein kinase [Micrococcales bacterium]